MKIGGFQIKEPVPECREPYALVVLRPWVDVNNVGSMLLDELEMRFSAVELGRLSRPGLFYDFTRYRPTIYLDDGIQDMVIPNTTIHYCRREGQNDLLLLRILEPHAHAEFYIQSVLRMLTRFNVKKYVLLGSMYDMVPHTRPLLINGYGMGDGARDDIRKAGALPITYHGPSTIANLITKKAAEAGIDATVFIVSLPQYLGLEEDYLGKMRLMELLNLLYDIPVDGEEFEKAVQQRKLITDRVSNSPEIKALLPQLEAAYDIRMKALEAEGSPHLTPQMEEILWKTMGKNIGHA